MNKWEIFFIASVCTIVLLCSYYSLLKSVYLGFRGGVSSRNRNRRRPVNEANPESNDLSQQFHSHGLESSILNSIPNTQFEKKNEEDDTERNRECAVCLGDFEEGQWLKHLPNCTHAFHVSCIDTWFQSHSNCPLCRSRVYDVDIHHESSVSLHTILETLRREDFFHERVAHYQILHSTITEDS